jgi:endonuclease/exonuclease/phosphatase family metal-dependent hydrolase
MSTRILFSNLGYLRGINGSMLHHVRYIHRHFYCTPEVQRAHIKQLSRLIEDESPDLCCFVEIDKGDNLNQLEALVTEHYKYYDIENKYGINSKLRTLPVARGKSNGFLANQNYLHEKIYFTHGTKRLIYKIQLEPNVTLFFAHFSLKQAVRAEQLKQTRQLLSETPGELILLGDFNIHTGFKELAPLLHENNLLLLNEEDKPTFRFHKTKLALDLCICSHAIAKRSHLRIIHQPYSDHDALILTIDDSI